MEGKNANDFDDQQKKDEQKEEVAKWDDTDPGLFKSEDNNMPVVEQPKKVETKESKTAGEIKFGGSRPTFGGMSGGAPKFAKNKNEKIVNAEEFPDLGGAVPEQTSKKDKTSSSKSGPPKFKTANNRFDGLQGMVATTNAEDDKIARAEDKRDRPYKPKKREDEFFGNFRSNNKEIKAKETEPTEASDAPAASGPPKFNFVNNKKGAMTMAKAQEEALKVKQEEEKNKTPEEKSKPKYDDKPRKHNPKEKKSDKFERAPAKESVPKPKAKKPKQVFEKADLGDSEWGKGGLEEMLQ